MKEIRKNHHIMGVKKIYKIIKPFFIENKIKMGRDALFKFFAEYDLLVNKTKSDKPLTTDSKHLLNKYPNIIKDFIPTGPNQLWVSDITYIKSSDGMLYLSLLTDAFSHKILGYNLGMTMMGEETLNALKMALLSLKDIDIKDLNLIHHSDRGSQYCNHNYVNLLKSYNIKISMTERGNPKDNAIAERINGILKQEYFSNLTLSSSSDIQKIIKKIINLYNNFRPHSSIGNEYPSVIHENKMKTKKLWKSYYKKRSNFVQEKI